MAQHTDRLIGVVEVHPVDRHVGNGRLPVQLVGCQGDKVVAGAPADVAHIQEAARPKEMKTILILRMHPVGQLESRHSPPGHAPSRSKRRHRYARCPGCTRSRRVKTAHADKKHGYHQVSGGGHSGQIEILVKTTEIISGDVVHLIGAILVVGPVDQADILVHDLPPCAAGCRWKRARSWTDPSDKIRTTRSSTRWWCWNKPLAPV